MFARVHGVFAEIEKLSEQGTMYRFEDAKTLTETLIGSPVYYGVDLYNRHVKQQRNRIGFVESAKLVGKRIIGSIIIKPINDVGRMVFSLLKSGGKFLFSIGGFAEKVQETFDNFGRKVKKYVKAFCNHLQLVDANVKVGFPTTRIESVEFSETLLFSPIRGKD